jgi:hypothetical protein
MHRQKNNEGFVKKSHFVSKLDFFKTKSSEIGHTNTALADKVANFF